jgi:hypothetical protein
MEQWSLQEVRQRHSTMVVIDERICTQYHPGINVQIRWAKSTPEIENPRTYVTPKQFSPNAAQCEDC